MPDLSNPIVWLIGAIALAVIFVLLRKRFSAKARARRRREKSNRPLVSRKPGPTVRLAVDVGKPKQDRKP